MSEFLGHPKYNASVGKLVDPADLKSAAYGVSVRTRLEAPKEY